MGLSLEIHWPAYMPAASEKAPGSILGWVVALWTEVVEARDCGRFRLLEAAAAAAAAASPLTGGLSVQTRTRQYGTEAAGEAERAAATTASHLVSGGRTRGGMRGRMRDRNGSGMHGSNVPCSMPRRARRCGGGRTAALSNNKHGPGPARNSRVGRAAATNEDEAGAERRCREAPSCSGVVGSGRRGMPSSARLVLLSRCRPAAGCCVWSCFLLRGQPGRGAVEVRRKSTGSGS